MRKIFEIMLSKIVQGAIKVTYWDGKSSVFGQGKPYFELVIKHPKVLRAMAKNVSLGFGEGYMNGDLEVIGDLDQVVALAAENQHLFEPLAKYSPKLGSHKNTTAKQAKLVQHHYDLGNDFYKLWLDESMAYSCAYFRTNQDTLEQAQVNKIDYLLKKLQLKPGQTLLDIGSGWGALLIKAAQDYGAHGLGVTLSKQQYKFATQKAKELGVDGQVKFKLLNYAQLASSGRQFDRVVSVGMFEHVGRQNHRGYFEAVSKLLVPGGISVLHTISHQTKGRPDLWLDKYIFPGGYLPTISEVTDLLPVYGLRLEDYENLRMHYVKTLEQWWHRFESHKDEVIQMYDQRFYRMWRLYLASSAGSFRCGTMDLSQFVFVKGFRNDLPLSREHLYK